MPRLNKRQQRELEALAELESHTPPVRPVSDEDSEPEVKPTPVRAAGFAALATGQDSEQEESEEEQVQQVRQKAKRAKKKKKPVPKPVSEDVSSPPLGKSNRKGKAKADEDLDEILKKMASRYPGTNATPTNAQASKSRELWELLSVQPTYLDGDEELRRFFGSKVVNSNKPAVKRDRVPLRSQLTRPPEEWRRIPATQGLSMRPLTDDERNRKPFTVPGERWWTVEHSQSYKKSQYEFLSAVALGDPNQLGLVLRKTPWHIDTLLQLSEVFRQQDDYTHATELVERAIYAYEKSFAAAFNVTTGIHRLDFDRIENRAFFLAAHRQILQLERRGCTRAAFEFARLLISLDPFEDPHGALLHMDYLGPRSGQNDFILKLWDLWEEVGDKDNTRLNPKFLPGMSYARALVLWNIEVENGDKSHEKSTEALKQAILDFPSVLPVLADKAGINLPGEVRALPSMRIETAWSSLVPSMNAIHLLSHLYAHRSSPIWKQPTHVEWMQKTVTSILPRLKKWIPATDHNQRAQQYFIDGPTLALCRHVHVCEIRSILAFIPPGTFNDEMHAYDPLPPASSISGYDGTYFSSVGLAAPSQQQDRLRQLRRQLAELQGGLAQFQMMGGDDDEEDDFEGDFGGRDEPDREPEARREPAEYPEAGHIPGAFEIDEQPEAGPASGGAAQQGQGFLQTLWSGLWGRSAAPADDDEEEEEDH